MNFHDIVDELFCDLDDLNLVDSEAKRSSWMKASSMLNAD